MMISLDWKERLKIDTEDFVTNKLSKKYYDIDVVYNAYPRRIDNKVPTEVINYVAKILANLLSKIIDEQIEFMNYLWDHKGENGHLIFAHLMRVAIKRKPDIFLDYLKKTVTKCTDQTEMNILIRTLTPLLKKDAKKYADIIYNWLSIDNPALHKSVIDLLLRTAAEDLPLLKCYFQKMERGWLYPTPHTIKNSSYYLKAIYKIDPEYYLSIYENYKASRNPDFIEILCNALTQVKEEEHFEQLKQYLTSWSKSGNVRIKKAATTGSKKLKIRKKKK